MTPGDVGCEGCEAMMQPYLDRELDEKEYREAEEHLEGCSYCRKRYRFEASLRQYVRVACVEQMDPALKAKLVALRTPLT
jgi:anti-sigma factor (TIGR02949 family)